MNYEEIINYAQTASIDQLKEVLSDKLKRVKYGSIVCLNQTFSGFYRARKHIHYNGDVYNGNPEIFVSENEFWNPPAERIKWDGRCNRAGNSLFYASNQFETAIKEIRPEVGKFVTVSTFEPHLKNGLLPSFRMKPVAIRHLKGIKGVKSCIADFEPDKQPKEFIEMDNFLDELFTLQVNDQYHLYKISNAITECMLASMVNDNGDEFTMNGMLYPSISDDFEGMNLILKPINCHHFGIKSIQTFYIDSVMDSGQYKLIHIRDGYIPFDCDPNKKYDVEWRDNNTKNEILV